MKKMVVRFLTKILVVLGICGILFFCLQVAGSRLPQKILDRIPGYRKTAKLSTEVVSGQLANASELVTQKLTMEGFSTYEDEGIPILSQGNFVMTYKSRVTAGIDASEISFRIDHEKRIIHVHLPQAEILSATVDPGTISYHGESIAIFNFNNKEDANKAQKLAESDARKAARASGILDNADRYARSLIKGLLQGVAEGYQIEFDPQK